MKPFIKLSETGWLNPVGGAFIRDYPHDANAVTELKVPGGSMISVKDDERLALLRWLDANSDDMTVEQKPNRIFGERVWINSERVHAEIVTIGQGVYTVKLETPNSPIIEVSEAQIAPGIPF